MSYRAVVAAAWAVEGWGLGEGRLGLLSFPLVPPFLSGCSPPPPPPPNPPQNKNATFGGIALCGVLFVYNMVLHFTHDHHHEQIDYPYIKKRTKPLPWGCSNCDLFDMPCWKKCKEAKA